MKILTFAKKHLVVISLLLVGLVMATHVFVNHLMFRTYALDLGVYTHALWQYAHGIWADCGMFIEGGADVSLLHDHFDLYLILLSPLVYIFGSYTLLVVQVVSLLFGAYGVFRFLQSCQDTQDEASSRFFLPWLGMLSYLAFFGTWHALCYDYHSNVVAVNFLPWMFLWLKQQRFGWALFSVLMICISKESAPLWMFFVVTGLMIEYWGNRKSMRWLVGYGAFCILYFLIVSMVVMPLIGGGASPGFWRYDHMGNSMSEVALFMLQHPWQSVCIFFSNFLQDANNAGLKLEFWLCCAASGMLLLLLRPQYLVMMLPPLLLKLMSRDIGFWGVEFQYNIEFAPILVIGSFSVIASWSQKKKRWYRAIPPLLAFLLTISTTIYTCGYPKTWVRQANLRIFDPIHYHQHEFDSQFAQSLIAQIPESASVCATSPFVPHLSLRDKVTEFPIGASQSDYLLLIENQGNPDQTIAKITEIKADTLHYRIVASDGTLLLISRIL